MSAPVRIQSPRHHVWFPELPEKLSEAAAAYPLSETADWEPLSELSSRTTFEGLKAVGEAAVIDEGNLVAPGTVYVQLFFSEDGEKDIVFHDAYPARVFFEVDRNERTVAIKRVEADTSSFFEG